MSQRRKEPLISRTEWRWFGIGTLALVLVSAGATALTAWLTKPEEPKNLLPAQSPFKTDVADTIPKRLLLSDFDLPAAGGEWLSKSWIYSREGGNRPWTAAEIAPFWVPVEKLPLADLPQTNRKKLDALFGATP